MSRHENYWFFDKCVLLTFLFNQKYITKIYDITISVLIVVWQKEKGKKITVTSVEPNSSQAYRANCVIYDFFTVITLLYGRPERQEPVYTMYQQSKVLILFMNLLVTPSD